MKKFKMLFAVLAISTVACNQAKKNEVKIGAVLPLTGDIAEYGKRAKAGIDMAVNDINSSGGINGNQISLVYEDDRGLPKDGVTATQKLISVDKTKFIVGAVASSVTLAMVPITDQNKVILFSPAASSPKLTGISKYFFRDWPSDLLEATVLSDFAAKTLKLKSVAILYVNNDYGLGLKNEFIRHFNELNGKILDVEAYQQGATDFRTYLTKIKANKPDAIYLCGYHLEMAYATKQIKELGITSQILGDADYGVQELLSITGGASEGAIFSIPEYMPQDGIPSVKKFATAFKAKYGTDPSNFEANGYDALMILAEAIKKHGDDTDEVSEYISTLTHYQGASGDISFNEKREVVKPISIKIVKNGMFKNYGN